MEQARVRAIQIKNAIASGQSPASQLRDKRQEPTLGQAFERYLARHAAPEGLKTVEAMRGNFERYLGAISDVPRKKHGCARKKSPGSVNWQNRKLSAIKPTHVTQLRASLAQEAGKAAANHALKLLRVIYNKMIEWDEYQGSNPAQKVPVLKIRSRDRFLQKDELPRLFQVLAATPSHTIRDYILLSILTGARKSNVLSMRWDQINFDRREWRIPDTKNNEPVIVQLPDEAVAILRDRHTQEGEWVFPGNGKSGHLESPKKGVRSILNEADITDLRIHDLRRTLGSWQAITAASLAIIGKSLGHRSVAATMIYARLSADPVRESVERATAAMFSTSRTTENVQKLRFPKCASDLSDSSC